GPESNVHEDGSANFSDLYQYTGEPSLAALQSGMLAAQAGKMALSAAMHASRYSYMNGSEGPSDGS
ncbi:hypothetical protein, partial [Arthrobacter wenxiniae]|uniref:hypothetical protein n=1 Tax=Arthrobacter wenxiniae TaxID=2713570 RepID=UPI001C400AE8